VAWRKHNRRQWRNQAKEKQRSSGISEMKATLNKAASSAWHQMASSMKKAASALGGSIGESIMA